MTVTLAFLYSSWNERIIIIAGWGEMLLIRIRSLPFSPSSALYLAVKKRLHWRKRSIYYAQMARKRKVAAAVLEDMSCICHTLTFSTCSNGMWRHKSKRGVEEGHRIKMAMHYLRIKNNELTEEIFQCDWYGEQLKGALVSVLDHWSSFKMLVLFCFNWKWLAERRPL